MPPLIVTSWSPMVRHVARGLSRVSRGPAQLVFEVVIRLFPCPVDSTGHAWRSAGLTADELEAQGLVGSVHRGARYQGEKPTGRGLAKLVARDANGGQRGPEEGGIG